MDGDEYRRGQTQNVHTIYPKTFCQQIFRIFLTISNVRAHFEKLVLQNSLRFTFYIYIREPQSLSKKHQNRCYLPNNQCFSRILIKIEYTSKDPSYSKLHPHVTTVIILALRADVQELSLPQRKVETSGSVYP